MHDGFRSASGVAPPGAERRARIVLGAAALAFGGPGLGFLLAPERFTAAIDVALLSSTGASDVRAVFGGLEIGLALWLAAAALGAAPIAHALVVQCAVLGGMIVGRVTSLAVDGAPGPIAGGLFLVEIALFAASIVALRALRGGTRNRADRRDPAAGGR